MIGVGVLMLMSTSGFVPSTVKSTVTKPVVKEFVYEGDMPPVGYFDPLKLTSKDGVSEQSIKLIRESELAHGRVAMLAATVMPFLELVQDDKLAINCLSGQTALMQLPFWLGLLAYEGKRLTVGWENPFGSNASAPFTLKKDYQPGNVLGFDMSKVKTSTLNSELANGRLAMIAAMHMLTYEYYTGHSFLPDF